VWFHRFKKHGHGSALAGFIVVGFRWLLGGTWHGGAISDRGWFRPGTRALTSTGYVHRRHHEPRWKAACRRMGTFLGLVAAAYGLAVARAATEAVLLAAGLAAVAGLGWLGWQQLRERNHRRSWLAPLHATIHHQVSRPVTDKPRDYIHVELDRSAGHIALPAGVSASLSFKRQLETDVAGRLGLEAPEFRWAIAGPQPRLEFEQAPPPPDLVTLEMARGAIEAARPGHLVLGLGKRSRPVDVSIIRESPHLLVNGPTNSGKSVVVRSVAAQFLFHGGFCVLMDHKELSHTWADSADGTLPNIAYCRSDEEIHRMLLYLQKEMRRRNSVARAAARRDGSIAANVGARILVVCEEINVMADRLRAYWAQIRQPGDPSRSPAIVALNELLFMARQVKIHILQAAQRADAHAVGGGAARENLVARVLIGKVQKPTWKMLAGEFEQPPMSLKPGRGFLVTDQVQEVQTILLSEQEAWDLALAGEVEAAPHDMPYTGGATGKDLVVSPGGGAGAPVAAPPAPPMLSLREYCAAHSLSLAAARTWRNRYREKFPAAAGYDGPTELYLETDLDTWHDSRKALQ
jgi:hypothetical protein